MFLVPDIPSNDGTKTPRAGRYYCPASAIGMAKLYLYKGKGVC